MPATSPIKQSFSRVSTLVREDFNAFNAIALGEELLGPTPCSRFLQCVTQLLCPGLVCPDADAM